MKAYLVTLIAAWMLPFTPAIGAATPADRTIRDVQFAKGASTAVLTGSLKGYAYVDYRLWAGAGQRMRVHMRGSNAANYFNVLPPDSQDAAMFVDGSGERVFDSVLPADGSYTLRVFLMRAAARRNESSQYTISIAVIGKPLAPVPAAKDALISGTSFHARAMVICEPEYTNLRECEALVVRRSLDGTATVELRWDKRQKRRILFVKGTPTAADALQPFTFTRNARGYVVIFGESERFEVPEPLVFGG